MTEQEIKNALDKGFEQIKPEISNMTHIMMNCYEQGFNTCWKLLTGRDFK